MLLHIFVEVELILWSRSVIEYAVELLMRIVCA